MRNLRNAWWKLRNLFCETLCALNEINRKLDILMTKQEELNAMVARIDAAVAGIREDIRVLKEENPAVDFSALEERVAGLEGLDAENPSA